MGFLALLTTSSTSLAATFEVVAVVVTCEVEVVGDSEQRVRNISFSGRGIVQTNLHSHFLGHATSRTVCLYPSRSWKEVHEMTY